MIVLDSSAAVDFLLERGAEGEWVTEQLSKAQTVHAPHLIDLEITSALRGLVRRRATTATRAETALADLAAMPLQRYPVTRLLTDIWALRETMTSYDAAYVALAEALGVRLVTTDARLARAAGRRVLVEAFTR